MLYAGDVAMGNLRAFKFAWLCGRTGGGKTALAYMLALELLYGGWVDDIVSNIPGVGVFPSAGIVPVKKAIIIDEGGLYLKFSRDFEEVAAFLRKQENFIILPSFIPPAREFGFYTIQRTVNFRRILPIPFNAWLYKWSVDYKSQQSSGSFLWTNPEAVFGLYDTKAAPADDAGISEWIQRFVNDNLKKRYGGFGKGANKPAGAPLSLAGELSYTAIDYDEPGQTTCQFSITSGEGQGKGVVVLSSEALAINDASGTFSASADRIAQAAERIKTALRRR